MKNIVNSYITIIFVLCTSCNKKEDAKKAIDYTDTITKEDSIFVEESLLQYKNCLFSDLYAESVKNTYHKKGIIQRDSLRSLTYHFYSGFNPEWMLNDPNRKALFIKWLNDETYTPIATPPDHPVGSLDVSRALDFYNSEDLEKYLDSLRQSEYNRLRKIRN